MTTQIEYSGNYILLGPPGTGKTRWLADKIPAIVAKAAGFGGKLPTGFSPVLICSLTRTAASEIASRVPGLPDAATATIHAHGYRSQDCPDIILPKHIKEWNRRSPHYKLSQGSLSSLLPETMSEESPLLLTGRALCPGDEFYNRYNRFRHMMKPRDKWPPDVRMFARRWECWKEEQGVMDWTDMIENASDTPPLNPSIIIVDEAQDTSPLSFQLLQKWGEQAGALILVGDPWQCLYEWAGAKPGILTDESIETTHRDVLSQSYRVPPVVHKAATSWIRQLRNYKPIEYKPRVDGETGVAKRCVGTYKEPLPMIRVIENRVKAGKTCMVMGLCDYHLTETMKVLKELGIPYWNPWRRSTHHWNPLHPAKGESLLSRMLMWLKPAIHVEEKRSLWKWEEIVSISKALKLKGTVKRGASKEINRRSRKEGSSIVSLQEMSKLFEFEALAELGDWGDAYKAGEATLRDGADLFVARCNKKSQKAAAYPLKVIRKYGAALYDQDNPLVSVGTIHSFKGAEADVVFVFPDLSLAGYRAWEDYRQRDALVRTYYVAMTRAREELYLCSEEAGQAVIWPLCVGGWVCA